MVTSRVIETYCLRPFLGGLLNSFAQLPNSLSQVGLFSIPSGGGYNSGDTVIDRAIYEIVSTAGKCHRFFCQI